MTLQRASCCASTHSRQTLPRCRCLLSPQPASSSFSSTAAAAATAAAVAAASAAAAKANAARAALDLLLPAHRTIGIGSGSTIVPFVSGLASLSTARDRRFVPTSWQSRHLLISHSLPVVELDQVDEIDITFDGADDINSDLEVIKGGGACHLREKVVAQRSKELVILADWSKESPVLGSGNWQQGVPLEVVPCALGLVTRLVQKQHGFIDCALRQSATGKTGPTVTDNGNFVLDVRYTDARMSSPRNLLKNLKTMTGVVEVGLFVDLVSAALIGMPDGTVKHLKR